MNNLYDEFTNLYPVSKTLRFELKPIGKTMENIEKKGLLEKDEILAEDYKQVKKIIDRYHKDFIDKALSDMCLTGLEEYANLYYKTSNDAKDIKQRKENEEKLRKQIADKMHEYPGYGTLFKEDLIKKNLIEFCTEEELPIVRKFERFTTYFVGFHKNRENMYSAEEKSTAISYRIINQNLPKFLDNIKAYHLLLKSPLAENISILEAELKLLMQVDYIDDVFSIDYFNAVLTQKGIDNYNQFIGGYSDETHKIKGINEYINLYNQTVDKNKKIPLLKSLYKQVLSDRSSVSFIPDSFNTDRELLDALYECSEKILETIEIQKALLNSLDSFDSNGIFLKNDASLQTISQRLYDDWSFIQRCLEQEYDGDTPVNKKTQKFYEKRDKHFKSIEAFSVSQINDAVKKVDPNKKRISSYFAANENQYYPDVINNYESVKKLLIKDYPIDKQLLADQYSIDLIKGFLDAVKSWQNFIKPFNISATVSEKDEMFYTDFLATCEVQEAFTLLYNKVRNYLTKKPYSTEKIKLNFNNSTLMNGWAAGVEVANGGLLFRKDGNYYLGIINNEFNKDFKEYPEPETGEEYYEKMKYLQAADPQKDIQNLMMIDGKTVKKNGRKEKSGDYKGENIQLEKLKTKYLPQEINRIRLNKSYAKGETFDKNDLITFIDYYKQRAIEYFSEYRFNFYSSSQYEDFGKFTDHINNQAYQLQFQKVSKRHIDCLIETGKLFLFQIYNKDFSEYHHKESKKNLHTLYWEMVFDDKNLADVVYKLNGEAEVFYRKASITKPVVHPQKQPIQNKNILNKKKESVFEYDLIKDRRYTVDKFQLHVPISMNFKAPGIRNINPLVNEAIYKLDEVYAIGIDRGERHLLYYSVVDSKGKIVEQGSLNTISNEYNGQTYETNYEKLLSAKEEERKQARLSWATIENIKDLKDGYMSQVVHKISELMIKYNAILVLEDLNIGFMRGRQKVEKQVYQKFEKALIEKLNYYVDKKIPVNECGGLLKAYQLTNKFESFQKMGKQSGLLYYVPAWMTSKIDPTTGFTNLFYAKYENIEKARAFIEKFKTIKFNANTRYFEFEFDYNDFTFKAEGTRTKWTLCTYGQRIKTFRNPEKNSSWDNIEVDLTTEFKKLMQEYGIDYADGDIKNKIIVQESATFYKRFIDLFKLVVQMRNSVVGSEIDYLVSPVMNSKGEFYDSRMVSSEDGLPNNADANGAYNIARKGLWIIEQIQNSSEDELGKVKMVISNKEWLAYAQR